MTEPSLEQRVKTALLYPVVIGDYAMQALVRELWAERNEFSVELSHQAKLVSDLVTGQAALKDRVAELENERNELETKLFSLLWTCPGDIKTSDVRDALAKWKAMEARVAELTELQAKFREEEEAHAELQARCYDRGGTFSNVFDEVKLLFKEKAELEARLAVPLDSEVQATVNDLRGYENVNQTAADLIERLARRNAELESLEVSNELHKAGFRKLGDFLDPDKAIKASE